MAYFSDRLHGKPTETSSSSWPQIMKMIQQIFMTQLSFFDLQVPTILIANYHLNRLLYRHSFIAYISGHQTFLLAAHRRVRKIFGGTPKHIKMVK
jgi:hypothetical protein